MSTTPTIGEILAKYGQSPITTAPDTSVKDVAAIMTEKRIGIVLLEEADGSLAGVVSERDMVRAIANGNGRFVDGAAIEIGTRGVATCHPDDGAQSIYDDMRARRIRHMPVLADGRIAGMISMTDLLSFFRDESSPAAKAQILHALSSGLVLPGL